MKMFPKSIKRLFFIFFLLVFLWGVINLLPVKKAVEGDNPWRKDELTLISAHRGGAKLNPENTKKAFDYVIRKTSYTDIVELDVRLTSENELVIIHDKSINRTGIDFETEEVVIRQHTYEELSNYNLGVNFEIDGQEPYENLTLTQAKETGLTIMRLEDFLNEYKNDRYFRVYLEIKDENDDAKIAVDEAERLLAMPEYSMWNDRVMFISFSKVAVNYTLDNYPNRYVAGMGFNLVKTIVGVKLRLNPLFNPRFHSVQTSMQIGEGFFHIKCATKSFVNTAHKRNQSISFWTVNEESDMRYLISLGVDCITTDSPDLLAQILGKI